LLNFVDEDISNLRKACKYKVVQIWPGLLVCKQVTVCPGHIWTTLYLSIDTALRANDLNLLQLTWFPSLFLSRASALFTSFISPQFSSSVQEFCRMPLLCLFKFSDPKRKDRGLWHPDT
jgi:hypothetical protein